MQNNPAPMPNLKEIQKIASSPAGQQLIAMLQRNSSPQLQSAAQKAAKGDYSDAKNAVQALLSDPKTRALLAQLGNNHG